MAEPKEKRRTEPKWFDAWGGCNRIFSLFLGKIFGGLILCFDKKRYKNFMGDALRFNDQRKCDFDIGMPTFYAAVAILAKGDMA